MPIFDSLAMPNAMPPIEPNATDTAVSCKVISAPLSKVGNASMMKPSDVSNSRTPMTQVLEDIAQSV